MHTCQVSCHDCGLHIIVHQSVLHHIIVFISWCFPTRPGNQRGPLLRIKIILVHLPTFAWMEKDSAISRCKGLSLSREFLPLSPLHHLAGEFNLIVVESHSKKWILTRTSAKGRRGRWECLRQMHFCLPCFRKGRGAQWLSWSIMKCWTSWCPKMTANFWLDEIPRWSICREGLRENDRFLPVRFSGGLNVHKYEVSLSLSLLLYLCIYIYI